jgi:hypothetical protein
VRNFGHIAHAEVELGDLTVLVGQQASGKSLALQLLKLCVDGPPVIRELSDNGFSWKSAETLGECYFGEGMGGVWNRRSTRVSLAGEPFDMMALTHDKPMRRVPHQLLYIPAQRALTIMGGWPEAFGGGPPGTPYVVRRFAEILAQNMRKVDPYSDPELFPHQGKLKEALREAIDSAFFNGVHLVLDVVEGAASFGSISATPSCRSCRPSRGRRASVSSYRSSSLSTRSCPAGRRRRTTRAGSSSKSPRWDSTPRPSSP